jgi:hypothetical protein
MAFLWKHPNSKYWYARFTDAQGVRRNCSTRILATDKNRREAMKVADEYELAGTKRRTALQVRRTIAALHKEITGGDLATLTLKEHVNSWLASRKSEVAPATFTFYKDALGKLTRFMGDRADTGISEIQRNELIAFRDSLGLAPKTVNHHVKVVRMLFLAAKRDELIADNPAEFLATVKTDRNKTKARSPFTVEQLRTVIDKADPEWQSMILAALYTGQRLSDIARLKWSNFDLTKGRFDLVTSKTGKRIQIPIAGPLETHLKSLPRPTDPDTLLHPRAAALLKARGRAGQLSNEFAKILTEAGLRTKKAHRKGETGQRDSNPLTFHSIRGTATSFLHAAGVPSAVTMAIIGHDSAEIHSVYTTMSDEIMRDSISKMPEI